MNVWRQTLFCYGETQGSRIFFISGQRRVPDGQMYRRKRKPVRRQRVAVDDGDAYYRGPENMTGNNVLGTAGRAEASNKPLPQLSQEVGAAAPKRSCSVPRVLRMFVEILCW